MIHPFKPSDVSNILSAAADDMTTFNIINTNKTNDSRFWGTSMNNLCYLLVKWSQCFIKLQQLNE